MITDLKDTLTNNFDFFKSISTKNTEIIVKNVVKREYKQNEVIYDKGSKKNAGIFFLLSGKVNISDTSLGGGDIYQYSDGDCFNILSIYYDIDDRRAFKSVAKSDVKVAFLEKSFVIRLCEDDNNFKKMIYDLSSHIHDNAKLGKILRKLYGEKMSREGIQEILTAGEFIHLPDKTKLFELGEESDSLYFIVSGLLKAYVPIKTELKEVGQIYEGEVIGEMGIISNEPRSATVYATRRSIVFKISKSDTSKLMMKYPRVLLQFASKIADRLRLTSSKPEGTDIYSLLSLSIGEKQELNKNSIGKALNKSIASISSCYFLSKDLVNDLLSVKNINKELSARADYAPLEDLLFKLCENYRYLILCCDMDFTPWTSWCLSYSETSIYTVNPSIGINNENLIYEIKKEDKQVPGHLHDEKHLMIYHESRDIIPQDTHKFFDAITPIKKHYHIALDDPKDIDRVSRTLIGKSIGLCLAGGGAKGNAHIGVYKALLENNIPVDVVCGTSAGGIVASLIAFGHSPNKIIELLKESYSRKIFKEYTLPYSSIIATKKVVEDAKLISGNRNIEDLWLPLFMCSVNISTSELVVHDHGPIWKATRATSALPGILLPVIQGNSLLVDGGLINNMPGDILVNRYGGKLISVSVNPKKDLLAEFDEFPPQASYFIKKLLFKKKTSDMDIPNLGDILMRSIMVSSAAKSLEVKKLSDIFLNPKIDGVGMLEFDSIEKSVEVGYSYTMKKLEKIDLNLLYK
tara:strand:- start:11841 stop:14078 length:2238 start_codon:yes stop_codon:yes gene_type:complete